MSAYRAFVFVHLIAGVVALSAFWAAAVTTKGSSLHKRAGKIHLVAMTGVIASAIPITADFFVRGSVAFGLFLVYLIVLVGTSVWCGWRAVRDKRDWSRYTGFGFRMFMWLNLFVGAAMVYLGLFVMDVLPFVITVIGVLGIANFGRMYLFSRRAPRDSRWWLTEHFTAMIASGAGGHVAFLFFGLPKALPFLAGAALQNFAWLGPIVAASAANAYMRHKYAASRHQ